ncbi:MAG: DNA replication/repair protein RecF [Candidatus Sumerlaeaceae bacterium]|jgi:DNA replication and repair protein RecF
MEIREVAIRDFRNLRRIEERFDAGLNLIFGRNAQGKTNLLEALHMLVTGRSFRTRNERELVPWNSEDYSATIVRAKVQRRDGEDFYHLAFNKTQKFVSVNGDALTRLGDLVGRLNAVLFTPADLQLVQGAPSQRRRFLDICLSQTSRLYLQALQRYDAALRQRNAVLKMHQRKHLATELAPYNQELAASGALIMVHRAQALEELSALARSFYEQVAGEDEMLNVHYSPSVSSDTREESGLREKIKEALERMLPEDSTRGVTNVGPHRDDFGFRIGLRDARDYASQGQQRTCVLALKFAELSFLTKRRGEPPVLFLDDLMSELDAGRRTQLLECLPREVQTFITLTERELVPGQEFGGIFEMKNGELRRVQ